MKLAAFTRQGVAGIGLVEGAEIADLIAADPRLPGDLRALLKGGDEARNAMSAAALRARRYPLAEVRLRAPIPAPRKFLWRYPGSQWGSTAQSRL